MPTRTVAIPRSELIARVLVGFLLGNVVGIAVMGATIVACTMFAFGLHGVFPDARLPFEPPTWLPWVPLFLARAGGVVGAIWFPLQAPRKAWLRHARTTTTVVTSPRKHTRRSNGWVDFVFRMGLGICCGVIAAVTVEISLILWSWPHVPEVRQWQVFALLMPTGMLAGFVWFACDFPWFRTRRVLVDAAS